MSRRRLTGRSEWRSARSVYRAPHRPFLSYPQASRWTVAHVDCGGSHAYRYGEELRALAVAKRVLEATAEEQEAKLSVAKATEV